MVKKIVQINGVCNGSTGRIIQQIQETAIESGMDAVSFYGRGEPGKIGKYIKIGNNLDIKIHGILTRLFDMHGHGSKKATKKMIKQIKEINPDIIQLHNIHGYYLNIKTLFDYLKKEYTGKIFWTLHDCWSFTGHCSHFSYVKCDKWKTGCCNCPQKKEYPKSILIDNSKKEYLFKKKLFQGLANLTIITPSKWLAELVERSFLQEYKIEVINNGIDLDIFKPRKIDIKIYEKYKIDENKKILLGVATVWNVRKGLDNFIELSKRINKNIQIVLVGVTKKQIKKLPSNIIGIERTEDQRELVNIYNIADVFFNPSYEETFSLVTVESMACQTPVICFKNGSCVENLVRNTGYIVNNNTNEILNKIDEIINDNNKKNRGKEILKEVMQYSSKDKYQEYIQLYNSEEY